MQPFPLDHSLWHSAPRIKHFGPLTVLAVSLLALGTSGALAQSATPGSVVYLDPVEVDGKQVSATEEAKQRLDATPGGTALVTADQMDGKSMVTVKDALEGVPGVVVQNFFGGNDQPRIQIRGSGLQQNPVQRGILALQDGLPLNQADGSYIAGFANPQQAAQIEVYRGYTANRLGATVLGGALNFISPTGSSDPGVQATLSGGSNGQISAATQAGGRTDSVDAFVHLDRSQRDGYRDYNQSERTAFDANVGAQLSDIITTRLLLGYTDLSFDVAGPLPKALMDSSPKAVYGGPATGYGAGPNVIRDQPHREATQLRLGNRTTAQFGDHVVDTAIGYSKTDDEFTYPISAGVQATDSNDYTAVVRYAYSPDGNSPLPLFESSLRYAYGTADREYYINRSGAKGTLFGRNDLESSTLAVNAGLNVPVAPQITLSPALTLSYASRDNQDLYGSATRPVYNAANGTTQAVAATNTSYSRDYAGFSPSLGLSFRPNEAQMLFGTVSRSFEPPTHDDLLATVGGTPNSSATGFVTNDLDAQTATTVETGWRGKVGQVSLDAVTYYSWVREEILSLRDATGVSLGAVNADKTRHFGIELGGNTPLTDQLSLRTAYTFQDFRFVKDPVRGNNLLAGAPRHVINAGLTYDVTTDLSLRSDVTWSPTKTPVDNMNTLYADPYATLDLGIRYALTDGVSLFGEINNLFDTTYAASTLVVDQATSTQAAFLPADGRSLYAGVKAKF